MPPQDHIPDATVARLPLYLRALAEAADGGAETISSDALAAVSGVSSANVRKDLSHLGALGTRGVGYRVEELVEEISDVLGVTQDSAVAIVGVGNLGRALASYGGFAERGFHIAALVDANPEVVGTRVAGWVVEPFAALDDIVAERDITIGVLATPVPVAQGVADALVDAGVTAILNFAPTHLEVPAQVTVRKVDLSTELAILSFYRQLHVTDAAGIGTGSQTGEQAS